VSEQRAPLIERIPEKMVNVAWQGACWLAPQLGACGKIIVFAVT
jgi:hypothetical protein